MACRLESRPKKRVACKKDISWHAKILLGMVKVSACDLKDKLGGGLSNAGYIYTNCFSSSVSMSWRSAQVTMLKSFGHYTHLGAFSHQIETRKALGSPPIARCSKKGKVGSILVNSHICSVDIKHFRPFRPRVNKQSAREILHGTKVFEQQVYIGVPVHGVVVFAMIPLRMPIELGSQVSSNEVVLKDSIC